MGGKRSPEALERRAIQKMNHENAKSRRISDASILLCESLTGASVLTDEQRENILVDLRRTADDPAKFKHNTETGVKPKAEPNVDNAIGG